MRIRPLILGISLAVSAIAPVYAVNPTGGPSDGQTLSALSASSRQVYLVTFTDPPLALSRRNDGSDARAAASQVTRQDSAVERRLDMRSANSRAYLSVLAQRRNTILSDLVQRIGRPVAPRFVYTVTINGVALELTAGEADVLRDMPGVKSVQLNFTRRLLTDSGPKWIKADTLWTGAAGVASRGEGTLVGVVDSGINPAHPAFAAAASDGYVHVNPKGAFLGTCASGNTQCNAKLIGIYNFRSGDEPENVDKNGHGTHVASTAAGNPVNYPVTVAGGEVVSRIGSGVAPRANLISYKACVDDGGSGTCSGDALLAAIEQATQDGVDVINYSIGGLPDDPWQANSESMAMLAARQAGVVVVVAAGNSGPQDTSVSGPGNAPWVLTAAAATHTRVVSGSTVSDDPAFADQLATFSGRGPNTWLLAPLPAVLKPDLTAPGVNVLAAGRPSDPVGVLLSGTSMATPHIAGAAALLRSAHPDWSPSQIISALQTTARASARTGNAIGRIFDQGSGVVDLSRAVRAGLYFDAVGSPADGIPTFEQANPFAAVSPGQPRDLNVPYLLHDDCFESCTLRRRISDMGAGGTWNVTVAAASGIVVSGVPNQFTLVAGASRVLDFHFDVSAANVSGGWNHGTVTFSKQQNDGTPDVVVPLALKVSAGPGPNPEAFRFVVDADAGMREISLTGLRALPQARFSGSVLVRSVPSNIVLTGDPTPDDPFDDATGTNTAIRVTVPEDSAATPKRWRVLVRAASSSAQDIDLYVGIDNNRDGKGSFDELVCLSADADADELCQFDVTHPGEGGDLRYWVAVQNFAAGAGSDSIRIDAVAIPLDGPDSEALSATGPGHVDRLRDIDLRVRWDDPSFLPGESRFGLLRVRPSADAIASEYLIELERAAGSEPVPRLLRNGVVQPLTLAPGASHERVFFDVPANATSVLFEVTVSAPRVDLFVSRLAAPNPPDGTTAIERAPPRNQAVASLTGTTGNKRITLSGAQLAPGRWYVTPVSTFQNAPIPAPIRATVLTATAPPALRLGHYFNAARVGSSSGVFVDRAPGNPDQWVVVWYTYLEDGTPTWYISQNNAPQAANDVFSGPLWRVVWDGGNALLNTVGHVTIVATDEQSFSFSYSLEGQAGSEQMSRLGGPGCISFQGGDLDVTGHWFTESRSGFGYSVQIDAGSNQEIFAAYLYDAQGFPRWLFGQQGFLSAGQVDLRQFTAGPCPTCAFAKTPDFSSLPMAGLLIRDYVSNGIARIATSVGFVPPLTGSWAEDLQVQSLSARKLCQ